MDNVDPMYLRQLAVDITPPRSVAVVGCGGVGSWTAYLLALAGVDELWLYDFDTISESNLNRIPVSKDYIDRPKTEAIETLIHTVRPNCNIMKMSQFSAHLAELTKLEENIEWIVATTDSLKSRKEVSSWASDHGIAYIEAAAEGDYGSATGTPADWATEAETNPGYQSVPVWVGPCVSSALIATSYILHNQRMGDDNVRLGWVAKIDTEDEYKSGHFDSQVHTGDE